MEEQEIIEKVEILPNNFSENDSIYISQENIKNLVLFSKENQTVVGLLITPFLICVNSGLKYELHYYEISTEISKNDTEIIGFPFGNKLPKEITDSISPKLFVRREDYSAFENFLSQYFNAMKSMEFADDKQAIDMLEKGAKLFYEVL
ncbi:hypothetical protein ACN95T_001878 [Listeria monocytogenes]|uniref:hypothetical protein n=1 Tax=Listeria monocytogenes TaxID=1639 RepID=UPI0001695EC8|nr:hypothetical protein [Listeria monocytogenes]EAC2243629.1 hypothetical protein [Listeria monocytogenes]EAC4577728.1 hypothetical protein [Listeria monocytogenes]EAC4839193.1 hypothetical protein [Listeria monocytogenes]EAC5141650.1 hypothetical protein [Listeria monocytogenes]EAC7308343.1 hypothetical protein [Listeria monocytogenes]